MIIGSGIYVDFPTSRGNLYPKATIESALKDEDLRRRLSGGQVFGGIFDRMTFNSVDGIITHKVNDIRLFNDEIIADIELFDDAKKLFESLKHPEIAIIIECDSLIGDGMTVHNIKSIETVHIRERASKP
jgi:hypothetical protein